MRFMFGDRNGSDRSTAGLGTYSLPMARRVGVPGREACSHSVVPVSFCNI